MKTLKSYRTWEVKANEQHDEKKAWSKPFYVHEMNPKKGRNGGSFYGFASEEAARIYAAMRTDEDMEHERKKASKRAERAAAKKAVVNPFCVGMIFRNSWGYDQTNVDYYQITRVTPRGVYIRPIGAKTCVKSTYSHGMADMVVPAKDEFHGDEQFKPLQTYGDGKAYISAEHGCMSLTEEYESTYRSWYH